MTGGIARDFTLTIDDVLEAVLLRCLSAMYGHAVSTIQSEQEWKCFMKMSMTSASYYRFRKSLGGTRDTVLHDKIFGRWTSTTCDTSAFLTSVESSSSAVNRSVRAE